MPWSKCGQNLRFFLSRFWPDQKLDSLFMIVAASTVAIRIIFKELFMVLSIIMKKVPGFCYKIQDYGTKAIPYLSAKWPDRCPIFMTKTAENHTLCGCTYLYSS